MHGEGEGWRGVQQFRKVIKVVISTFSSTSKKMPMFWTPLGCRMNSRFGVIVIATKSSRVGCQSSTVSKPTCLE